MLLYTLTYRAIAIFLSRCLQKAAAISVYPTTRVCISRTLCSMNNIRYQVKSGLSLMITRCRASGHFVPCCAITKALLDPCAPIRSLTQWLAHGCRATYVPADCDARACVEGSRLSMFRKELKVKSRANAKSSDRSVRNPSYVHVNGTLHCCVRQL